MDQAKNQETIDIGLGCQYIGGMKVFVVAEGVHKIQFVRRQEMLEQIRGIFLQHSNDEVNLYLTPACELS